MSETEKTSIAKQVLDYNKANSSPSRQSPILPPGIVGKFFTCQSNDKPYQNAIVFEDGSELTISFNGDIFWSAAGEWKGEAPGALKVELPD